MLPIGNGYFIWQLERLAVKDQNGGMDFAPLARSFLEANLSWVAIKISDGPYKFNHQTKDKRQIDMAALATREFVSRGIRVWGWSYVYGYMPEAEAEVAAARTKALGMPGFIINAEVEYKGKTDQAKRFMRTLRRDLGSIPAGICSYRYPTYHRDFPWEVFIEADFNAPQVYWIGAHNAGSQLMRSVKESRDLRKDLPIIPIGAAFTQYSWIPTPAEIKDFRKTSENLGLLNYGWWETWEARDRNPHLWLPSTGGQSAPPSGVLRKVSTKYNDLRLRTGPGTSFSVSGYMTAGVVYEVVELLGGWGRLASPANTWVALSYTYEVEDTPSTHKVATHYKDLRVRSGPGLNYSVLGYMTPGKVYEVAETSGTWLRFTEPSNQWVSSTFTYRVE